jgi:hypothetical protein
VTLQAPVAWQPSLSLPPAGELTTALCTFITNGQEIDPMDQETLAHYMPHMADRPAGQTLADIILAKLEAGAEADAAEDEGTGAKGKGKGVRFEQVGDGRDPAAGLPAKVVEAYTKIGELLSRYKSGPLPKPFKLLPSLPQWARLLALTSPADWSPHATFAATKIFVSNLKPRQATIFLRGILLERVRDDMRENGGKLNYQLYEALKKSLYKPAAFFKGILFPLCDVRPLPVCPASLNTLAPKLTSPLHTVPLGSRAARSRRLRFFPPSSPSRRSRWSTLARPSLTWQAWTTPAPTRSLSASFSTRSTRCRTRSSTPSSSTSFGPAVPVSLPSVCRSFQS